MENWHDRTEVKKGDYGEGIVRRHLESRGWIVYEPKTQGAHAFDKLCVRNKKEVMIAEVKTKARMNKWNATGFNVRSLEEYRYIQNRYGIRIVCFFVDELLGSIYGETLEALERPYAAQDGSYPMRIRNIVLFSLEVMRELASLTDEEKRFLMSHSQRKYEYNLEVHN